MGLRLAGHWWDGSYSTLWRKDIWLRTDGVSWVVELRRGDSSKKLWRAAYDPAVDRGVEPTEEAIRAAEQAARAFVAEVMARNPRSAWRDIYMPSRAAPGDMTALRGRR